MQGLGSSKVHYRFSGGGDNIVLSHEEMLTLQAQLPALIKEADTLVKTERRRQRRVSEGLFFGVLYAVRFTGSQDGPIDWWRARSRSWRIRRWRVRWRIRWRIQRRRRQWLRTTTALRWRWRRRRWPVGRPIDSFLTAAACVSDTDFVDVDIVVHSIPFDVLKGT